MLPAEHRVVILSAIATATLQVDVERALTVLNQLVASSNDSATRPRRGRFNPKIGRAAYSSATDASNDSALILFSSRGLCEVLNSGEPASFLAARAWPVCIHPALGFAERRRRGTQRLEALVLALRGENRIASALNELAALRLKQGPDSR